MYKENLECPFSNTQFVDKFNDDTSNNKLIFYRKGMFSYFLRLVASTLSIMITYVYSDLLKPLYVIKWTMEHSSRWASLLCTLLILLYSYFTNTFYGCFTFLIYLLCDTFLRRDGQMKLDNKIHHTLGIIISLFGLYILHNQHHEKSLSKPFYYVNSIIQTLLQMEITTPFLHVGWILKEQGEIHGTILSFVIVLLLWIPFRILYPIQALGKYMILNESNLINNTIELIIFSLICMQIIWFTKLCVAAKKLVFSVYHIK